MDLAQPARNDQALHDTHARGAELGPAEIPVLAAHRNHPQRALQMIRVYGHIRIREKDFQAQAALRTYSSAWVKGLLDHLCVAPLSPAGGLRFSGATRSSASSRQILWSVCARRLSIRRQRLCARIEQALPYTA